jgi:transposase
LASITKKTIRGKPYYYARECKRVNGKPKIVRQQYLGRAEDIIAAVTQKAAAAIRQPKEALVTDFGDVVALYDLARRLKVVQNIDAHVPKAGSGPSVGTYMLVAVLNRCVAPCSKASIADWFKDTALRRLLDIEPRQLTSQRYWDNMDRVPREAIAAIENDLVTHMVREFDLDVSRVLFDATNFFTFIDTFNTRSTIAQRGKSKEGRASLRIVGLALLVSADFHVPLLHRTYPGNQADSPTFASLTEALVERYRTVTSGVEHITIVFDKGNNSQDNLEAIADSPYHFVGSLVPTHHKDLLKIHRRRFCSLADDGLADVSAHRTTKKVFGVTRTVVVTYNEKLFVAQSQTLLREIAKRQQRLRELQQRLRAWRAGTLTRGRNPTVAGVRKKVQSWLKARHMKELFHADVTELHGLPKLTYRFDHHAWQQLQSTLLGKTILFTDNDDWSDAEIVRGYRAQHHVESAFRDMKDPHCIAVRPQFHWTDQKIEVHVFCCVLALLLCTLLRRELHRKGIDRSVREIITDLRAIREVGVLFPPERPKRKPVIKMTLAAMTPEQRQLYDALDLGRYRAA